MLKLLSLSDRLLLLIILYYYYYCMFYLLLLLLIELVCFHFFLRVCRGSGGGRGGGVGKGNAFISCASPVCHCWELLAV